MPARLTAAATLMLSGKRSAPSRALPRKISRASVSASASARSSSERGGLRVVWVTRSRPPSVAEEIASSAPMAPEATTMRPPPQVAAISAS
ncbi:MAG: hypothetical protein U0841_26295 [Chloroflexia bacterium]